MTGEAVDDDDDDDVVDSLPNKNKNKNKHTNETKKIEHFIPRWDPKMGWVVSVSFRVPHFRFIFSRFPQTRLFVYFSVGWPLASGHSLAVAVAVDRGCMQGGQPPGGRINHEIKKGPKKALLKKPRSR